MTLDERITRYVDKCPPAVSGSRGHDQTYTVACALVNGFALTAEDALRHLRAYNARCSPPWKERDLRHKVSEAEKKEHDKPRGHLLGMKSTSGREGGQQAPTFVPVRLTPRKRRFGTLGTLHSGTGLNACAHTCTHAHDRGSVGLAASRPSQTESEHQGAELIHVEPSQASQVAALSLTETLPADDDMIVVPGCRLRRPVEIEMTNTGWRALEASGFAEEPNVQLAAWMFGPCTVVEPEEAAT